MKKLFLSLLAIFSFSVFSYCPICKSVDDFKAVSEKVGKLFQTFDGISTIEKNVDANYNETYIVTSGLGCEVILKVSYNNDGRYGNNSISGVELLSYKETDDDRACNKIERNE